MECGERSGGWGAGSGRRGQTMFIDVFGSIAFAAARDPLCAEGPWAWTTNIHSIRSFGLKKAIYIYIYIYIKIYPTHLQSDTTYNEI